MRHYLATQGFKLTAITFQEEAGPAALLKSDPGNQATILNLYSGYQQRQAALDTAAAAQNEAQELQQQLSAADKKAEGVQVGVTGATALTLTHLPCSAKHNHALLGADAVL